MSAFQKIFQRYGAQYLALYEDRMPRSHKKTIRDIIACRKGRFGTMVYECRDLRGPPQSHYKAKNYVPRILTVCEHENLRRSP